MNVDNFADKSLELSHYLFNQGIHFFTIATIALILLMLVKLLQRISVEMYFKNHPEEDPFNFDNHV
ncbi:hypothetical protein [Paraclostridium bifermentans]|uniref:hypothetical protein n=1 Tax=Paraclostridium bifermentans TaxID=1490 RepID=UPI001899252B|nr:hypothetical protein [Paraclostridium bifermentans]